MTRFPLMVVLLLAAGCAAWWLSRFLFGWWRGLRETRSRVLAEDAVKYVHTSRQRGETATIASLQKALGLRTKACMELIARLERIGWLRLSGGNISLTPAGVELALEVIRAHRLWERYLVDEARMPVVDVHVEAERREHTRLVEDLDALEAAMGHPTTDPHGDPIPTAKGELAELHATALTNWPLNQPGRIVHLEDEPPAVFAQIAAVGLHPGQTVWVTQADEDRIVLCDGEHSHVLAPVVSANIFVTAVDPEQTSTPHQRLTALSPGEKATIHNLDESIRGFTRRRLLDLGLTPGAEIKAEMSGLFRDPVAYRIRGTLIALRRDQAAHVLVDTNGRRGNGDG